MRNSKSMTPNVPWLQPRYKSWKGASKFICGGRLMLGVHASQLMITIVLILITWVPFLIIIHPFVQNSYSFIFSFFVFVVNLLLLLATAFVEPGFIPRNFTLPSCHETTEEQDFVMLDYCQICNIYRYARTKHCKHCDSCVSGFDHHW